MELVTGAHRLEERVLNEILGLGRVASQLACDRIECVQMPDGLLCESVGTVRGFRRGEEAHWGCYAFLWGA
jgi:hypothetical protein